MEVLDGLLPKTALKVNLLTVINRLVYLSLATLCLKLMLAQWLKLSNLISRDTTVHIQSLDDMPTNFGSTNVRRAYDFLTGDGIVERSGGALQANDT